MCALVEKNKYFNFVHYYYAFSLDIKKIVANNIGDNDIVRSKKFSYSFNNEVSKTLKIMRV